MRELRVTRLARSFRDILNNGLLLFIPPFLCLIRVSRRNRDGDLLFVASSYPKESLVERRGRRWKKKREENDDRGESNDF